MKKDKLLIIFLKFIINVFLVIFAVFLRIFCNIVCSCRFYFEAFRT